MKRSILVIALLGLILSVAPAFAHDGSIGSVDNPVVFSDFNVQEFVHPDEQAPWKGAAFVYVKNTTTQSWKDFHFQIWSWTGQDVSSVAFKDASMDGVDPISSQSPITWAINNNATPGATLDIYFGSDPIAPGEVATFQLYTDNTSGMVQFGLAMFPTTTGAPVPEPSSILALAASMVGMAGIAWRRYR